MPSKKNFLFGIVLIVLLLLLGIFSFIKKQSLNQNLAEVAPSQSSTPGLNNPTQTDLSSELKTYVNEKYGYSYEYTGELPNSSRDYLAIEPAFGETETSIQLEKYAYDLWELNKNDKVPNIPNHTVSDLEKITQNGRLAFRFTAEGSFVHQYGGNILDEKTTYILTANQNNTIFIIHYPTESEKAKQIFSTLRIDSGLIAVKEAPSDWKKYENKDLGFQFQYPGNIFTNETELSGSYVFAVNGKRGGMSIRVLDTPLDPENIEDMYGKIENPEKVKVGNRDAYAFNWGDAGCGAKRFDVAISSTKTLRISFSSCSEDLYLVSQDTSLQSQILSTFEFSQ
ncbi:MAG: hypothetical protein PHS53_04760 [Candidatus Pacebacteria bacterium]|nr:hypothetical protein [Candidatus Paceibacterota bacterium]MDD5357429.1 hypothetical protein [Candidatus Paceibacterota bacterium]